MNVSATNTSNCLARLPFRSRAAWLAIFAFLLASTAVAQGNNGGGLHDLAVDVSEVHLKNSSVNDGSAVSSMYGGSNGLSFIKGRPHDYDLVGSAIAREDFNSGGGGLTSLSNQLWHKKPQGIKGKFISVWALAAAHAQEAQVQANEVCSDVQVCIDLPLIGEFCLVVKIHVDLPCPTAAAGSLQGTLEYDRPTIYDQVASRGDSCHPRRCQTAPSGTPVTDCFCEESSYIQSFSLAPGGRFSPRAFVVFKDIPPSVQQLVSGKVQELDLTVSSMIVDPQVGHPKALSLQAFSNLGEPIEPPAGVDIAEHIVVTVGLPNGLARPIDLQLLVADDERIATFELWANGILLADEKSVGSTIRNGSYGGIGESPGVTFDPTGANTLEVLVRYRTTSGLKKESTFDFGLM